MSAPITHDEVEFALLIRNGIVNAHVYDQLEAHGVTLRVDLCVDGRREVQVHVLYTRDEVAHILELARLLVPGSPWELTEDDDQAIADGSACWCISYTIGK